MLKSFSFVYKLTLKGSHTEKRNNINHSFLKEVTFNSLF